MKDNENQEIIRHKITNKQSPNISLSSLQTAQPGVYDQLNQLFEEKDKKQKTILEARVILGEPCESLTDDQIYDLINEIQFLTDTWIEEFEQNIFNGKTLNELLEADL